MQFCSTTSDKQQEDITKIVQEAIKVVLPDDGHPFCDVVSWYPAIGDSIKTDDLLCEIETPDYSYDFEARDDGYLAKVMIPGGAKGVEPGTILAYLAKEPEHIPIVDAFFSPPVEKEEVVIPSDASELEAFLSSLENDMSGYVDTFSTDGFDSLASIATITKSDLASMGVKKGHIRVIMKGIQKLNEN